MTAKRIVIIAGPNGAGKTTFAREFLPNEAGRLMLEAIGEHVAKGESFAFETTLSGLTYARMIPRWREEGYVVKLIFLSLPDAEMALERVAARVTQGGHDVPEVVVRRRFAAGIARFHGGYKSLVDFWQLYDNACAPPMLIEEGGFE